MKTVTSIETKVDTVQFGYWDMETEEFVPINGMSALEMDAAAELLECTPLMLDALMLFADSLTEAISADLIDIWKRV